MTTRTLMVLATLFVPAVAHTQSVDLKEWPVPWGADGRPRDPYVDPQGRVWFVGQQANYIAYLEPRSGDFKQFTIEPGTHPHNLIIDRNGVVWYAGNRNARIGRLDPKDGSIKTYLMPDSSVRDPHTLIMDKAGNNIWFTAQGSGAIGRLNISSGKIDIVKTGERTNPYGIAIDSKGHVWANLFRTNTIAMIDPNTLELTRIALPRDSARSRRLVVDSKDAVWYVDYAKGYLGRYDAASNKFEEWLLPSGATSRPYGMAIDDRDRIWLVESGVQPNNLVGFDPKTKTFFATSPIESGGGTVRHMYFHPQTKEVWFGTDKGTIGRAKLY